MWFCVRDVLLSLRSPLRTHLFFGRRPTKDSPSLEITEFWWNIRANNGGVESNAMAFSPLDVFLKTVLNSRREITSASCGACSMSMEPNMIWIITFWNQSTFLMIYWDAALECILHWPYSDFRVDRFWRWDDTKNKNRVTKPAQTGL